ncbi:zf-HC2 domain-containing protein [Amycolatopsis oliviviridis]|uniref:zf-HC2 domain-containing protein n=1 Tax=Amycolatopsis oliviviridis TaxID=1471590 RepID=UPI001E2E316F|nr:zf-HC2 domain-containing protein [Amycolatopsis oliviviridis]
MKHTDAAAYVLGVLDRAEAHAFERHLKGCVRCGRQVAEFTSVEDALARADLRYLSPGAVAVRRCGRPSRIVANLVVLLVACVVAALMSAQRSSRRYRPVSSDAGILSPAPLDDVPANGSDQRLLPLPLTFK